jgi:hypothetical protein
MTSTASTTPQRTRRTTTPRTPRTAASAVATPRRTADEPTTGGAGGAVWAALTREPAPAPARTSWQARTKVLAAAAGVTVMAGRDRRSR